MSHGFKRHGESMSDGGCRIAFDPFPEPGDEACILVGSDLETGGWMVPVDALRELLEMRGMTIVAKSSVKP